MEQVKRGIEVDSSCAICEHDSKDIVHAIRDWPGAKKEMQWNVCEIIKIPYSWAKQYGSYHKKGLTKWQQVRRAIPWLNNWVQLNSDGSIKVESGIATLGGVLHDREGKWIFG
ncbi:hypothetical protein J1N35_010051 [Gossypium stocksii]|uniref:RNase H type-1 domain-containing protein n=1 Tax=Gossypium stocksii TaxID=47602 RepID=A0A9D3W196_9ROSI|nr:hypothetical protein J1N35_010051 [Gossypium stocksii]